MVYGNHKIITGVASANDTKNNSDNVSAKVKIRGGTLVKIKNEGNIKCETCGNNFSDSKGLKNHVKSHRCHICEHKFKNSTDRFKHVKKHVCKNCKRISDKKAFEAFVAMKTETSKCVICNDVTVITNQNNSNSEPENNFAGNQVLEHNMEEHYKQLLEKYPPFCIICETLYEEEEYQKHMIYIHRIRPRKCADKKCEELTLLGYVPKIAGSDPTAQVRCAIHNKCTICGEIVNYMEIHRKVVHKITAQRSINCNDCHKKFQNTDQLYFHRSKLCEYRNSVLDNEINFRQSNQPKVDKSETNVNGQFVTTISITTAIKLGPKFEAHVDNYLDQLQEHWSQMKTMFNLNNDELQLLSNEFMSKNNEFDLDEFADYIENTLKHKCEICGKRFKIEVDLETHYADVHEMTDEDLDEMISLNDDYKCEEILSQKNQSAS